jgi:regulatory LacI family protein
MSLVQWSREIVMASLPSCIERLCPTIPPTGKRVMSTTIKEVASLAAVSTATVSRVVNGTGNVSGKTKTRVLTAISRLQYYPNAHAAELGRARGRGAPESCTPVQAPGGKRAKRTFYRRARLHHEEKPEIETVAGELSVWRDQDTDEIVIESSVFAQAKKRGRLISLTATHARHLANSLLLIAAEAESSLTFTETISPIQVAQDFNGDQSI